MKVAMLIGSERMKTLSKDFLRAYIFDVENDMVMGVESEYLSKKDINYISLWLLSRRIKIVYVDEIEEKHTQYMDKLNIEVRTFKALKDNTILKAFLS